jgi:protein TonB
MRRFIIGGTLAVGVSLGLFYGMNQLISGEATLAKGSESANYMNFIRVKHEKPLEPKKRTLPKEPPKPKKPPPRPKINNQKQQIVQQDLNIDTPKLDIPLDIVNDGLKGASVSQNLEGFNSGIAVNLMPIFKIKPRYPNRAKVLKKEGFVVLEFVITKEGFVRDIKVIKSEPAKLFDSSAKKALTKWRFKPKIVGGKPVEQRAQQTIDFKLKR